jgi:hypothetical protein
LLVPLKYYRADNDIEGVPMHPLLLMNTRKGHVVSGDYFVCDPKIVLLADGKLHMDAPWSTHKYLCLARLRLSTINGLPPPGQWRIGYRDGDVTNVRIENLFWRGDDPVGRSIEQTAAFVQGIEAGGRIVDESKRRIESAAYLRGVNYELGTHLQFIKG